MVEVVRLPRGGWLEVSDELRAKLAVAGTVYVDSSSAALRDDLASTGIRTEPLPESGLPDGSTLVITDPTFSDLVYVVTRLLGPGGCPWDQAQTHESLKRHLIEESHEVCDAIDSKDWTKLEEELGDLLLQPLMHSQIAWLDRKFDVWAVVEGIRDKLIRRHPHVFGDGTAATADDVLSNWDRIKSEERGRESTSRLAGVPRSMPSLMRALEVSTRAARAGFEWPNIAAVYEKLDEERAELDRAVASQDKDAIESEIGDLLFTVVNVARWLNVEPEEALRRMIDRFCSRFSRMESQAGAPLESLPPERWDELWQNAKFDA